MAWYAWAVILFVIGAVEHAFSEYENLVSVRLKIQQTIWFAEINRLLDGVVYIITFSLFWKGIEQGQISLDAVIPYFCYVQGCVLGTALALMYYKETKKKTEHQKRMQRLEKANRIKKQLKELRDDIVTEVETEMEFDEIPEQESKDAGKKAHNQVDNQRESSKKEDSNKTTPPSA